LGKRNSCHGYVRSSNSGCYSAKFPFFCNYLTQEINTAFIGTVRNYSTNNMHHNKEDLYFPQHYHQIVTLLMLGFTLTISRKMKPEMTMMMTAGMGTIIICNIK